MTELVDRIIDSLSAHHDRLAARIGELSDEQLTAPSGASQWRVCDVLSHLGSGAEIMRSPLEAAVSGMPAAEIDNQAIWDRWDAASPRAQANGFVERDATIVNLLVGLEQERRFSVFVDLGFLPDPVQLVVAAGMRLNEVAQHAWDVAVADDPTATLDAEAAEILLDLYAGPLGFLLGFTAKPDTLSEAAMVSFAGRSLVVDGGVVSVEGGPPASPTGTFVGPAEAMVRLIGGRLTPAYTPAGVELTGSVSLDQLRQVFPGY